MSEPVQFFDNDVMSRVVRRIALEILAHVSDASTMALVGVRRGGVPLAREINRVIANERGSDVLSGTLDIALYRDDAATALPDPKIGPSEIPFDVTGRDIILVDDVLQTGRTIRAAIDALLDYGRPKRIWLAVLLDRGGRELPVAADFVGRIVEVPTSARIDVIFEGENGRVELRERSKS